MSKDTYHRAWAGNWYRGGANWIENWLNGTLIKDEPHDDRAMMRDAMTKLNQAGDDIDELKQELESAIDDRDNYKACAENWEANAAQWSADWHELKVQLDAALEREAVLAAQMMNLADALEDAEAPDAEAGDMWDASQCAEWIREQSPWVDLTRRDLIKQAEGIDKAIEQHMVKGPNGYFCWANAMRIFADELRQRAQELTK